MYLRPDQLANALGIKYSTLRAHINRKKLIKSENYINTDLPKNALYINEKTAGKGLDLSKISNEPENDLPNESPETESTTDFKPKSTIKKNEYEHLELSTKRANLLKAQHDAKYRELQTKKMMGELMPVELVEKIIVLNIQGIYREFEAVAERIASIYNEILRGNRETLTKMIHEMRKEFKVAAESAKETTLKDVKNAIESYFETFQNRKV